MPRRLLLIWMLFFPGFALAEAPYLLNPGDLLEISVWKEESMEREVLVLPDGLISFPLAGHLQAAGKTTGEIEQALTSRLQKYFPAPVVTVSVKAVAGNKIFVLGQVNNPGEFLAGQPIDVMQALSLAGGLTTFAEEDEIKVLRRRSGAQVALPFDFSAVQTGRDLSSNIILQSGDVVVVPKEGLF